MSRSGPISFPNPAPHPDLVMVKLFRDAVDLFVLAEPGEQAESRAGAEARLRKGPLILAGRVTQSQELLDKLATSQLLPPRILSCGDLELVKSLVLAGLGVAVLPRRVAAYWQEGKLRRLHASLPFIKDQIYLVFRADAHRMRAWTRTKDALTQSGKELDASFEV